MFQEPSPFSSMGKMNLAFLKLNSLHSPFNHLTQLLAWGCFAEDIIFLRADYDVPLNVTLLVSLCLFSWHRQTWQSSSSFHEAKHAFSSYKIINQFMYAQKCFRKLDTLCQLLSTSTTINWNLWPFSSFICRIYSCRWNQCYYCQNIMMTFLR